MPRLRTTFALLVCTTFLQACFAFAQAPEGKQQKDKPSCDGLVGTWQGPDSTIELKRDGTTEVNGVKYRYTANNKVITLVGSDGTFYFPYQLKGDTLNVLVNGSLQTFHCVVPGTTTPQRASAGNGQLSDQLLTSSAWCTFSYNKITGYSHTTRWTFYPDGTYSNGARTEGYSSGGGGTMASQHDSRNGGRWKVVDGQLYIGQTNLQPVQTVLKRNNNGYPVIVADGVEYSQCK